MPKGGKSGFDRNLANEVRRLSLNKMKKYLEMEDPKGEDKIMHDQILLKLAGTALPRVNEHTGEDGEAIEVKVINYGNYHTVSVPTETVSTAVVGSTPEIQDSSDSSPRGEVEDSTERTNSENPN